MLSGEQVRAGRGLARMEQAELAKLAGLSVQTVKRLERTVGPIAANTTTEAAVRSAFAGVGVIFIDENGGGPGVRLRKATSNLAESPK